jgi:hypothetical protein
LKVLVVALVIFMMVNVASASRLADFSIQAEPARVPGVRAGDWAKYSLAVNYTTTDPNPPWSAPPADLTDLEYYKLEVVSVVNTNITFKTIVRMTNGSEITVVTWTDVANPGMMSSPSFLIAANLSVGDKAYPYPASPTINGTTISAYAGSEREVNYLDLTQNTSGPMGYLAFGHMRTYWDRASGIIDEFVYEILFKKIPEGYLTSAFMHLVMSQTNIWKGRTISIVDAKTGLDTIVLGYEMEPLPVSGYAFTVNVTLDGTTDYLHSYQVTIAFDNTKLKCTAVWVSKGDPNFVFFGESPMMGYSTVMNQYGVVVFGSSLSSDYVIPDHTMPHYVNASGGRLLCQINFTAIEAGNSTLEIATEISEHEPFGTFLLNTTGLPIDFIKEGFFVVVKALEPEPSVRARIEIFPQTLNLKSRGRWILASIELPKGNYAKDINVSSIRLNGTISADLRFRAIAGFGCGGKRVLIVAFDRADVEDYISAAVGHGCVTVTLTITGKLKNGRTFQGSDTIRILNRVWHNGPCHEYLPPDIQPRNVST